MADELIEDVLERTCQDILAKLRGYPSLNGIQVFDGQVTDGQQVATNADALINGYVAVVFGQRGQARNAYQGITGVLDDLRTFIWGVECYGRDTRAKRRIAGAVAGALEGADIYNCGEVRQTFSGAIENPLETKSNISREGVGLLFSTHIGVIAVG